MNAVRGDRRRVSLLGGVMALALGLAVFAAGSILETERGAAQKIEESPGVVRSSSAPTVTASAEYPNAQVSWQYDAAANSIAGWKLVSFQVWRRGGVDDVEFGSFDNDPDSEIFPAQGTSTRSYTDSLSHKTQANWIDGFKVRYFVRAAFQRASDGLVQHGQQGEFFLAVQPPVSPLDVVTKYPGPTLTAVAHSDGVQLKWQFNEAAASPRGWKLAGFQLTRWKETKAGNFVRGSRVWFNAPYPVPTDRSLKDALTGTTMEERLPGGKFFYSINAFYDRLVDGAQQVGKKSSTIVFTAPELPNVRSFRPRLGTFSTSTFKWSQQLVWRAPHLSWGNQFPTVSSYILYRDGEQWQTLDGNTHLYEWWPDNPCEATERFHIRTRYGLFFSGLINPDASIVHGGDLPCSNLQ